MSRPTYDTADTADEALDRCPECGCRRLNDGRSCAFQFPHADKVIKVPARSCDDCGRAYPIPGGVDMVLAPHRAVTAPPPANYPSLHA